MRAIHVKFVETSGNRKAHVIASTGEPGETVHLSATEDRINDFRLVARKLIIKKGWAGSWAGGETKYGVTFVYEYTPGLMLYVGKAGL